MWGAVILIAVKSDTCSTNQVTKTENYGAIHKMCTRKGEESSLLFITVCCLLCLVLLPSFPTIQILPFSLYHLSHTEVRMGLTQQGHCFVVLFYLFLDNEKSAEGLAWCLLPHIYTHGTLRRPYGLSTGGLLDSSDSEAPEAQILISPLQRVVMNPHHHASQLKQNNFFLAVSLLGTLSSPCKCFFTVIDRWLDCRKSSSGSKIGEKTSWTSDGSHGGHAVGFKLS